MQEPSPPRADLASLLLGAVKSLALGQLPTAAGEGDSTDDNTTEPGNDTADLPGSAAPELPRFRVGEVINSRYAVLRILGEGSMGVVYRVRDQLFPSRRVALKTMQRVADSDWLALFRAEFRALAELRHIHIAEVYDFEALAGQAGYLFTMEFVEGQELDAAMAGRDVKSVWRAVTEMAEALSYVHSHGRLHLDIKPSNAMLAADGMCRLLDFGLVGLTFTPGQFAGTPMYMAPEILQERAPDARSDLFSLGITAYQLLTGSVPYSRTTRLRELYAEKIARVIDFPPELHDSIPAFMRQAVQKLCALQPEARFQSAQEFLEATRAEAVGYGVVATRDAQRLERSAFVGREQELRQVLGFAHRRLAPDAEKGGTLLCCVGAPSGLGKSRLLAEARTLLQSEGYVFLQGDAYDHDVGEYTALAPLLLAASHLAHAEEAVAPIHRHGPELVKIVPEFGLPIVCAPSPAFSNGEAERARLIAHAAAFLTELVQGRPCAVYLNDLQWAGEATVQVLRQLLAELRLHPDARLALMISYRSDQIHTQPLGKLLAELSPADVEQVQLQGLSAAQVGALMGSMLLAEVSPDIAGQLQQATGGVPFLVEESTRWLLSQEALVVRNGACVVRTESGALDLHTEVGKGIVARAALQGEEALRCLQLLSVCARPIELDHLQHALHNGRAAAADLDLSRVLVPLEAAQFVLAVAGIRPRYVLSHDRIRESLFSALTAEARGELHSRLGAAFESFLVTTNAAELAVLAAVHQNATPAPADPTVRTRRCEVNLRAAEVAAQAADYSQALTFLDAAEELLSPQLWADHRRGMRLTYQRARLFGAMLRHAESLRFAQQAILHARDLVEEGQARLLQICALTGLRRYDEALEACVDFCSRLDPQAKLPQHPGLASFVEDVIRLSRAVERAGAEGFLSRLDEPEDPQRDLVYEMVAATSDAAIMARPMLFTRLIRHAMERLLRYGVSLRCRGSAITVVCMAGVPLGVAGKIDLAIQVGKAARRRLDDVPLDTRGRCLFVIENYIRHLDEPMRRIPPQLLAAASYCQQARDLAFTGYALAIRGGVLDYLGDPIEQLNAVQVQLTREPAVAASPEIPDWLCLMQGLRDALQGHKDAARPPPAESARSRTVGGLRSAVRLRGAALGVWPGPYRGAEYGFPALLSLSLGLGGTLGESLHQFHAGLVYLAALRGKLPLLDRLHFRAAAEFVTAQIRTRARYNPADYAHRIAVLDAEQLRNRGRLTRAVPLYERAARLAQENGWLNDAALVLEKFTEVLAELGDRERAHTAARESAALYRRWQAWAKVEQMERVAAALSDQERPPTSSPAC